MKVLYSSLERRFDELTPDWIVSTGRLLKTYGEKSKFSFAVTFQNGKTVHKASDRECGGIRVWRQIETQAAFPDFVVLTPSTYERFRNAEERCRRGEEYSNPFKELGCITGMFIEVLGARHHSGEYVQNLSRKEHEKEMMDAYESAGAKVLLLWQDEIEKRWDEVCIPKINDFLKDFNCPSWKILKRSCGAGLEKMWRSLADASYWRGLNGKEKDVVVSQMMDVYHSIEYPYPDVNMAMSDFRRFEKWASGTMRKSSRFGMNCCRHFSSSMIDARVKGKPSLREIWNDRGLMEKSIRWQLENESGSHNAKRFLNAMCHKVGFKVVANMRPAIAAMWVRRYGNGGDLWFDPCAGWGSRMMAAGVLGMKYVAIDANRKLVDELNCMAAELEIDAEIIHGDSSDVNVVESLMRGRKADLVFTSPPFFDTEIYSDDREQSVRMFSDCREWHENFLGRIVSNSLSVMDDSGVLLLNIGMRERLDWMGLDFTGKKADDFDIDVSVGGRSHKERIFRLSLGESEGGVQCGVCGRLYRELGSHVERVHGLSMDEYKRKFDEKPARKERGRPLNLDYKKKIAYRCPDGRIVRRRDAWDRAWAPGEPPEDSVLDASKIDKWEGKEKDVDYVECSICGHRGQNLTRHIKSHGIRIEDYEGKVKSEKCQEALSNAANASWDSRGRKEKRDRSQNKTHKVNGLNEETLRRLYEVEKLSDAKIGEMFDMTGEGVSYRRKKWGIKTRKRGKV